MQHDMPCANKNPVFSRVLRPSYSYKIAAEMKARTTYDNILRISDDPDVNDVIRFLRAREVVHYQRFGELLVRTQDRLNEKNIFAFNPAFDKNKQMKK